MIHFAYPNTRAAKHYIGCGRYVVSDNIPGEDYELADPDSPSITEIRTVAEHMVPGTISSGSQIYEKRDEPNCKYRGESLDMAYLLAYINTALPIKAGDFILNGRDIWCTGAIDIKDMRKPWLKTMDNQQFEIKLEAFLSKNNEDMLFIVPNANISNQKHSLRMQGVEILTLNNINTQPWNKRKTILAIGPNDVPKLLDFLFIKPKKSIPADKISNQNLLKYAVAAVFVLLVVAAVFIVLQRNFLDKQEPQHKQTNSIEGRNDIVVGLKAAPPETQQSGEPNSSTPMITTVSKYPRIAILLFENNSPQNKELDQLVKQLPDMIFSDFVSTGKYDVVERKHIKKIYKEIELSQGEYFDQSTAVQIGKMVGAQYVVFGSLLEVYGKFRLDVRVISVERGIAAAAEGITGRSEDFEAIRVELVNRIVSRHLGKVDS